MSKTNLELVQEVVEAKLNNLDNKIDTNNKNLTDKIDTNNKYVLELLTVIKEQTFKTNGKVISLDSELRGLTSSYNKHLLTSVSLNDINQIKNQIDQINDENFILKVWNKYPKALISIIVVATLVSIATLGYTMITVHNAIRQLNITEQIE